MLHAQWQEVFDIDALSFVNQGEYVRLETERGESLSIYTDIDLLERDLLKHAPQDAREIRRLALAVRRFATLEIPYPGGSRPHTLLRLLRALPSLPLLRWWSGLTLRDYGLRFTQPLLRTAFGGGETPELTALSLVFALAWMNDRNAGYPIGGSQAVIRPIVAQLQRLGGHLRLNAVVEKILVERDATVGVQLANGQTIAADWVVSAADGHGTIYDLLGGRYLDAAIDKAYRMVETFPSYVQVSLGVARDLSQHAGLVTRVLDTPIQLDPTTLLSQISFRFFHFDPTFAPPGKTAVTCILPTRNVEFWVDLQRSDPAQYQAEKDRVAQTVIAVLEKRIADLRSAIDVVGVSTPATVIRYTRNWKGSTEGWLPTPGTRFFMPNTLPGLRNFLMVGQWVFPGRGFPSGFMTARHAIQEVCRRDRVPFASNLLAGSG